MAHGKAGRYCAHDRYVAFVCREPKRHTALRFAVCPEVGARQRWSSPLATVPCSLCRVQRMANALLCALGILPCA